MLREFFAIFCVWLFSDSLTKRVTGLFFEPSATLDYIVMVVSGGVLLYVYSGEIVEAWQRRFGPKHFEVDVNPAGFSFGAPSVEAILGTGKKPRRRYKWWKVLKVRTG